MKAVIFILLCLLLVLTAFYPACAVFAMYFGYRLEFIHPSAFVCILVFLSLFIIAFELICKASSDSKAFRILSVIITPLSLFNACFYILVYHNTLVIVGVLISAGCCCYLTVKCGKPLVLKIISLVLSSIIASSLSFISLIALNFVQNTVMQTVRSPGGMYYAEVIDSDQGALGGDTLVNVYKKGELNIFIFKIKKKPQRVYLGEWGEYKNMQIYWKNENCLIINSTEYKIE